MRSLRLATMTALAAACLSCGTASSDSDKKASDTTVRHPSVEIVSGGGRATGGGMVLEVQLGTGVSQWRLTGTGLVIEGNATVKP
jgi:hypothetical protein